MDKELALAYLESKSMPIGLTLPVLLGGFGLFYTGLLWGLFGSFIMVLLLSIACYETTLQLLSYLPFSASSYIPASVFSYAESLQPHIHIIMPAFYILFLVIAMFSINKSNKQLLRDAINKK